MAQELEGVAFESKAPAIVQGLGGARDLGGVEFLMPIWWERRIHKRYKRCDRQRVRGSVRRAEKVGNRVACET